METYSRAYVTTEEIDKVDHINTQFLQILPATTPLIYLQITHVLRATRHAVEDYLYCFTTLDHHGRV